MKGYENNRYKKLIIMGIEEPLLEPFYSKNPSLHINVKSVLGHVVTGCTRDYVEDEEDEEDDEMEDEMY